MVIDKRKLDVIRANRQKKLTDLNVSKTTITRINAELDLKPCTIGKIAQALDCDVSELIKIGGDAD